jgi:hypothetical protein
MITATAAFNRALLTLAANGSRPRCSDPVDHALWTSEDAADRLVRQPRFTNDGCRRDAIASAYGNTSCQGLHIGGVQRVAGNRPVA